MVKHTRSIIVAVKGVIVHGGRILLVRRAARDSVGAGTWECAGGKIEFGEDLEAALEREIYEDRTCGYCRQSAVCNLVSNRSGKAACHYHLFVPEHRPCSTAVRRAFGL